MLWGVAVGLVAIHVILNLVHYLYTDLPWLARQIFDVDEEDSFPTWFSAMLLLLTSVSLWVNARTLQSSDSSLVERWYLLSVGFLLLSIDEIAGMHETLNSIDMMGDMSWTIPGAIVAGLAGFYFVPFLLKLPRPLAIRFVLAGAVYLGGALGVEVLTDPYLENDELNTLAYNLWTALEESMEIAGVLIFLGGLFPLLRTGTPRLQVQLD